MTKYFCDACGKEKPISSLNEWSRLCHIGSTGLDGAYVDDEMNRVSRREITKVLCNHCYNRVLSKAWQEYQEILKENENDTTC